MLLKELLKLNEEDDLIAKAKKVGSKFFAAGAGAGMSGFKFPKDARVIRMSLADFKEQATSEEDEEPLYGTMQSVFKPSEMKIYDKSDSPISASDFDKDGVLYVIDGEEGVYVITKEKPTVQSSGKESKSRGDNPTWEVTDKGGYVYTLKPERYPSMPTDPEAALNFVRDTNARHGPRISNAVSIKRIS